MKWQPIAVMSIVISCSAFVQCKGDEDEDVAAFCEKADQEFEALLQFCKKDRRQYWEKRKQQGVEEYIAKSKELQQTSKLLGQSPNAKELQAVFAFQYLNEVHEVQLASSMQLVEDLGSELLRDRVEQELTPLILELDTDFAALRKKSTSEDLRKGYSALLEIKRAVSGVDHDVPIKYKDVFMPHSNAFSTNPEKVIEYSIHDWQAGLKRVDEYRPGFESIQDTIRSEQFFAPKDPLPWLPIATQLTFLLVAMGGGIKSYHGNSYWAIGLLVVPSMLVSVFLVFYSHETMWNIARQSLIPGGFIIYWIAKNNNWPHRLRCSLVQIKGTLGRSNGTGHSQKPAQSAGKSQQEVEGSSEK